MDAPGEFGTIQRLSAALSGRYQIEQEIGAGGMATVFRARDLKHDREVALKVLREDLSAVLGADRFLREIRISAGLDHPHILTLIDSGRADELLYYVLPLVRGESLRARLEREGPLPIDDAVAIARQVAAALDYAHQRGVIHRDIKPENILLHEGEAVVTDFGIAIALSEAGGTRLTETGLSLGTPQYMSPEQATGDGTLDGRTDVYSLGAVLYEMLAGEPPFTGRSTQAVIARLLTERPARLGVLRETVPATLEAAVMKALSRAPVDRFATARGFADALATPTGPVPPVRVALRRGQLVAAGVAVVAAAVLAVLWARRQGSPPSAGAAVGPDPRHVAVLYLRPSAESLASLADGLTEGLIHALAAVPALRVVSANGTQPFRGVRVAPDSVRRALGVGSLIEGSIAQAGPVLRVSVSLVDAGTADVLGSSTFDRPASDVLALGDSVVAAVSEFLRRRLGEAVTTREERGRTRSADAWRLVQQAKTMSRDATTLLASGDTAGARRTLMAADSALERASRLDPKWRRPHLDRGWLANQSTYLIGTLDKVYYDDATRRGLAHAAAALALSPDDPEALTLRGTLRYWRFVLNLGVTAAAATAVGDSAEADLRSAVAGDPNQAAAWALLSHRLARTNKQAESKLAAVRAYEADPYVREAATILFRLQTASLDLEDRVEATRWCDEGRRRFPENPRFIECQLTVLALPGQRPDVPTAWRLLDTLVQRYPPHDREFRRHRGEVFVAMALVRAGLPESARAVAVRARADASLDPSRELPYLELLLRNQLGDREEALRLASEYYAANPQDRTDCGPSGTEGGDRTWWMRGLVDDPRYRAISCTSR